MGLNKKTQANYVKLKDGKFYLGKDKETVYDELEGQITDMYFKDEVFEGQTIKKLNLRMQDGGNTYIVAFPFDSAYTSSLVGFLKNADLTKPLTLVPVMKTEGEKSKRSLLVRQDDQWLKAFFTKDNPNGLPAFKKITKKSGKIEWDKENFLEFLENIILNEFKPKLTKTTTPVEVDEEVVTESSDATEEDAEELPF